MIRYDEIYPLSYYEDRVKEGTAWGLADGKRILAAATLLERDGRWSDDEPALYVHNFVSDPDSPGAGSLLLRRAEAAAREMGKKWLRLDCAKDNPAVNEYYEKRGFTLAGECGEGEYKGNLRQKEIGE